MAASFKSSDVMMLVGMHLSHSSHKTNHTLVRNQVKQLVYKKNWIGRKAG